MSLNAVLLDFGCVLFFVLGGRCRETGRAKRSTERKATRLGPVLPQDGGGSAELWALDTRTEEWCR
eukprot:5254223-Pyramimonas_sp.AAC.1